MLWIKIGIYQPLYFNKGHKGERVKQKKWCHSLKIFIGITILYYTILYRIYYTILYNILLKSDRII